MAAGLVWGVYVDTLDKLINNNRGKCVNLAVLFHQGDKLGHVHGLGLFLVQFSMEGLGLFVQRALFILIGLGQLGKTPV